MRWLLGTVLAGLAFLAGTDRGAAGEKAPPQVAKQLDRAVTRTAKLDYLLYLPEGYDKSEQRWPLLLFLHGAGETAGVGGNNLEAVKKHGPPKLIAGGKQFPFIVVSPQAPRLGWDTWALDALLDEVSEKYRVDEDRVYLTGLSMGGYGSWALAAERPDRFAAVVPICGGGSPVWARRLKNLPVWVFHGARDTAVPLSESERMVGAIQRNKGNVKLTVYPEAGHDSWTATYDNPALYDWLLQQRRPSSRWKGTWKADEPGHEGELLCTAVRTGDDAWAATFSGYCGRDFLYRVTMQGKQEGDAVRFRGEADLGAKDGGLYHWTGSMLANAFTGEYTSAKGAKGQFRMERVENGS